jgi:hypothetical protein
MSTSYHPETDGSSERTNKTLIQALRFHVQRNQTGWARALPMVCFHYMNTVNNSMAFSPFQLLQGRSPRLISPLTNSARLEASQVAGTDASRAADLIERLAIDELEAKDNLLLAKVHQTSSANARRGTEFLCTK